MVNIARLWTPSLNAELRAHAAAGGTDHEFAARHPGILPNGVRCQRAKIGAHLKSRRQHLSWTPAEDEIALRMSGEGASYSHISAALPERTVAGVFRRLTALEAQRNAAAAAPVPPPPVVKPAPALVSEPPFESAAALAQIERVAPPVAAVTPKRIRRIEPLFDLAPVAAGSAVRPKLGQDSWDGSLLAGVPIHPAHARGGRGA